jgi:hypothetical protein
MKIEPHNKFYAIMDCKLLATWNDGETEDLLSTLPDYLKIEIQSYLNEISDLRTEDPEDYHMEKPNDIDGEEMISTVKWINAEIEKLNEGNKK